MSDNNINLAALWVPVMAETSQVKGQLARAGAESAAAFGTAFTSSSVFKDLGRQLTTAITAGVPEAQRALGVLTAGHGRLAGAIADTGEAATRTSKLINGIGIASVIGFGAAVASSAKAAGDFQASMTRLTASAGESAGNIKTVSEGILHLAGQVGYSAQDLANAMYTVEKAGYRGADGVNVLKAAAQGAKSENSDLTQVLSGLTTSMNDFGFGQDQAADVMSKMVAAVGMAKTNFQDFAGALHSVEPAAAAAHIGLADVYGSLAQITQSGTSADQAAQNMNRAIMNLNKPTQQMRDEMGQFGINALNVQQQLGQRGLAGTVQYLASTIREHMSPSGQVVIDTMYKNEQAVASAQKIFDGLPPAAKAAAESIKDGTLSYKEFRKTRGGLDVEQANELQQWVALQNKITGFSQSLKSGQGDVQTYLQALSMMVGGQDAARAALQLTGENTDKTNKAIQEIGGTTKEHDGTVKGFNETQKTLNAQMADFKAAMGAARIELGTAFLPTLTSIARGLSDMGRFLAENEGLTEGLVITVGGLAAAYIGLKTALGFKHLINDIRTSFLDLNTAAATANTTMAEAGASAQAGAVGVEAAAAEEVVAEGSVTSAAGLARTALSFAGPVAAGVAVGLPIAQATLHSDAVRDSMASNPLGDNPVSRFINRWTPSFLGGDIVDSSGNVTPSHAQGGPIFGSGAKGKDSVLSWLAPGEHILTAGDVDAMGGHSSVYAFRHALHRETGGGIPGLEPGGATPSGPGGYTKDQAAAAIISASKARGLSPEQTVAAISVGLLETGLGSNQMTNVAQNQSGTVVQGLFQQDSGYNKYGNRTDPNAAARGFVDQFVARGGLNMDPYQGAVKVQVGTYGPDYVRSFRNQAVGYYDRLAGGDLTTAPWAGAVPAGGTPGVGPSGAQGYFMGNPQKVSAAQERLRHLDEEIRIAEERRDHLKSDASQAEKDRLEEEIRHLHAERDQAQGKLATAEQGDFHAGRGGGKGERGESGHGGNNAAQQFGSSFLQGLLSDFGFGNVLGGKSPLDWGIVKLGKGLAEYGMGLLQSTGGMGGMGGPGMGGMGLPGMGGLGAAGGTGLSGGDPLGGEGASGEPGSGGGNGIGAQLAGKMPSIVKIGAQAAGVPGADRLPGTGIPGAWLGSQQPGGGPGIHTQNDYKLWQSGVIDGNGNVIPHGLSPGLSSLLKPGSFSGGEGTSPMLAPGDSGLLGGGADRGPLGMQGAPPSWSQGPASHGPSNTVLPPLQRASGGPVSGDPSSGGNGPYTSDQGAHGSGAPNLPDWWRKAISSSIGGEGPPIPINNAWMPNAGGQPIGPWVNPSHLKGPNGTGGFATGGVVGGGVPTAYVPPPPRPPRDDKRGGPLPGGGPGGGLPSNGRDGSWPDWWRKSINEHFDDIPEWMPQWGMNGPNNPAIIGKPDMHPSHLHGQNGIGGFSSGGPSGTDTIPAWLSPGEFVMKTAAVQKYGSNFMTSVNAGKFASGGVVPLSPSAVGSVPTAVSGSGTAVAHHAPVTYDNRTIISGNTLSDPYQLAAPIHEINNAKTYSRAQFGGLPISVGGGGG